MTTSTRRAVAIPTHSFYFSEEMPPARKVKCPTCRKEGDWFAGQYGPFCSKRCKLVDLGKWLNEENKISEPLQPDHFREAEEAGEHLDSAGDESDN